MNQRKSMAAAEQLLSQGKVPPALQEIQKIADASRGDVVLLNRLGDLLARHKQLEAAVGYYSRIAEHFEASGFLPKAVAIHKKILRLDPACLSAAVSLGQLYSRQKLHGEARKYLLHAANQHLQRKEFANAREVFEKLVAGEPNELRHKVRLAEARAAEGNAAQAVEELVEVGESLLAGDKLEDAEKIFERANQLQPGTERVAIGSARCLAYADRVGEAVAVLEQATRKGGTSAHGIGELARLYILCGRTADSTKLLVQAHVLELPRDTWGGLFAAALEKRQAEALWKKVGPLFRNEKDAANVPTMTALLQHLGGLEPDGHIPALKLLADLLEQRNEVGEAVKALDALSRAYRARSLDKDAAKVLARLQKIAPPDEEPAVEVPASPAEVPGIERTSLVEQSSPNEIPLEAEAPAVPLNRTDEEFVEGRTTQAEVLEKYELLPQALEQLDEVAARFPGHAPTHERRIELLRALNDREPLAEVLAQLALARRAGGDSAGAEQVAAEAVSAPTLRPESRRVLEQMGLVPATEPPAAEPPAAEPQAAEPQAAPDPEVETPPAAPTPVAPAHGEVLIDLDAEDEIPVEQAAKSPAPATTPQKSGKTRVPEADVLKEIRAVAARDPAGGKRRLEALLLLGYVGPEMDSLCADLNGPPADPAPPADESSATAAKAGDSMSVELGIDIPGELEVPELQEVEQDQDMGQVLEAFKKEVEQQIGEDDHRMHYDLAIGYKEMGLIDEAIREFQLAVSSPDFHQEACSMIAMCHRDREQLSEAADWYRQALEKGAADVEVHRGIRYDLAEVLLQDGEAEEALIHFRGVLELDPAFRDVQGRVEELEGRVQS